MATSGSAQRVTSADASIDQGRRAYADGLHKKAIEHFTLVANACPCNKGGRRQRCRCKDFEAVAGDGGDVFREAMHTCSCGVARMYNKCHEAEHGRALDLRAAVFEKMARLDLAKKDAEWLLEIAPRSLEGYLRLGKIYRLEKKPDLAFALWTAGVCVGRQEGLGGSPQFKQLLNAQAPLQRRFFRKDPMELPVEIVETIFSYFSLTEMCRVQGVCKRWDLFLNSRTQLWQDVKFPHRSRPPLVWLKKLARRTRGNPNRLVVPQSVAQLLPRAAWPSVMQASLRVRHLELDLRRPTEFPRLPNDPRVWDRLVHLDLTFRSGASSAEFTLLGSLLHRNQSSLEFLRLVRPPSPSFLGTNHQSLVLNRLRHLHLHGVQPGHRLQPAILAKQTPNLEQLQLSEYELALHDLSAGEEGDPRGLWPNLQAISSDLRPGNDGFSGSSGPRQGTWVLPPLGSLRVFESCFGSEGYSASYAPEPHILQFHYDQVADGAAGSASRPGGQPSTARGACHAHLERYWVEDRPVLPSWWPCLEPALLAGRLQDLGVAFPDWRVPDASPFGSLEVPAQAYVEALARFSGAAGVRRLGLFNFDLNASLSMPISGDDTSGRRRPERDQGAVVAGFVNSFPDLEVLVLQSSHCESRQLAILAEKVAVHGKVQIICVTGLAGADRDLLANSLAGKGVQLKMDYRAERSSWLMPMASVPTEPRSRTGP